MTLDQPPAPVLRNGRYSVHSLIAAGGMATVHFGVQRGDDRFARIVAIKRLHGAAAVQPEFRDALRDEARVTSRIHHPNVVATLDVVEAETELWVVMEYVEGETLVNLRKLSQGTPMDPSLVATIASGVLEGLHAAHEAKDEEGHLLGVVHRDVSPQNIIIGTDGVPRVLDFGIAKAEGRVQSTQQGALKGKVAYMSPEQVWGRAIDRRADVFAASVVFWELLCGRKLHTNEHTDEAILAKVLQGKVDPPSSLGIHLPAALEAVLMQGLATDRDDRFATAHAMAVAIEEAVPLLQPRRLGEYVREVAALALAARRTTVAEVEHTFMDLSSQPKIPSLGEARPLFTPFVPAAAVDHSVFAPELLEAEIAEASLGFRRQRTRIWIGGFVGVLALLALLVIFGRTDETRAAAVTPPPTTPSASAAPAPAASVPEPTAVAEAPPAPPPTTMPAGKQPPATAKPEPPPIATTPLPPARPFPADKPDKKKGAIDCKRHPLVLDPKTQVYHVDPRCRSALTGK